MIAYCEVSAFTDTPGQGNRAGVVLDADQLSDQEMQALASFVDAPETVFVTRIGHGRVQVRYFTPVQEIEFCGHATVALGLVLAQAGLWPRGNLEVQTLIGRIPLRLEQEAGVPRRVWMTQRKPEMRPIGREWRPELAEALGVNERMIHRGLPLAAASTGLWSVFVPLLDPSVVDGLEPDFGQIARISEELDVTGVYAYAPMGVNRFAARDFAPRVGIAEDPVTGSSAGALMSLLAQEGKLPVRGGQACGVVYQGHAMGSPGEVDVVIEVSGQVVNQVLVGGLATLEREGHWQPLVREVS